MAHYFFHQINGMLRDDIQISQSSLQFKICFVRSWSYSSPVVLRKIAPKYVESMMFVVTAGNSARESLGYASNGRSWVFGSIAMRSLSLLFVYTLFRTTFGLEMAAAQSLGAREASLLTRNWDRNVVSKEDRIRAIEKIANLRESGFTDEFSDEGLLTGLIPIDTTLKYVNNKLHMMSDSQRFWIARNLLGTMLVVDTSSTELHEIVVQLLASSSYAVHFQTVHTLLDVPIGSDADPELFRKIRQAIASRLEMLDIEGEGALCRRLLYRMQRALGPNDLIESDVHSCLQRLTQDAKYDSEIIAEALVCAATLHEFPFPETQLVEFAALLDERSEGKSVVEFVRLLFSGRLVDVDATSLREIARKAQHNELFFEVLEKNQFPLSANRATISRMAVTAAVLNEDQPPNIQLWQLAKEPFSMIIEGKSQLEWLNAARRGNIAPLPVNRAGIAEEDPIVLLSAIDGQSFERTLAVILKSDKMWYRLYQLENLFLIEDDLVRKGGNLLMDKTLPWYVKYLFVRELMSTTRVNDVVNREMLASLVKDDQSPYFILTRKVLSLAKSRNIRLEGATEDPSGRPN